MRIASDVLKQLRAEWARLTRRLDTSSLSRIGGVLASPQCLTATIRKSLRLSLIVVGLGGGGLGLYWWVWPVPGDGDGVHPEHETGAGTEIHRVDEAPSRLIDDVPGQEIEDESVTVALTGAGEHAAPMETDAATGVDATHDVTEMATETTQPAPQGPVLEPSPSMVTATLDLPLAHTESRHATTVTPSVVEDVPVSKQRATPEVQPSTAAPLMVAATADASSQRNPVARPRPRNETPAEAALTRARNLIAQRRYARAVTVLSPLFVAPPRTWEPWFWLGTAYLGLGQWEKARALLKEGIARDAAVPQLWVHQALVSQQQGRHGEALEALRQAELLAPQLPEVQLNLAYSLEVRGPVSAAIEHYRTFLALTKDNVAYNGMREKVRKHLMRLAVR